MSYKNLYDYCQTLEPVISTKDHLLPKVLEITKSAPVKWVYGNVDEKDGVRGAFLDLHEDTEARIIQQYGTHVIVIPRSRKDNRCWKRFIYTKELMHLFDKDTEKTNTPEIFEQVLTEFIASPSKACTQTISERKGFWMALAVLCPEKSRLEFIEQLKEGIIDNLSIATKLRIPELYVPSLFQDRYPTIIKSILN